MNPTARAIQKRKWNLLAWQDQVLTKMQKAKTCTELDRLNEESITILRQLDLCEQEMELAGNDNGRATHVVRVADCKSVV